MLLEWIARSSFINRIYIYIFSTHFCVYNVHNIIHGCLVEVTQLSVESFHNHRSAVGVTNITELICFMVDFGPGLDRHLMGMQWYYKLLSSQGIRHDYNKHRHLQGQDWHSISFGIVSLHHRSDRMVSMLTNLSILQQLGILLDCTFFLRSVFQCK